MTELQKSAASPVRKTFTGFILKLAVVLIALGVYAGLNQLEALKTDHNKPLMLVDARDEGRAKRFAQVSVADLEPLLGPAGKEREQLKSLVSGELTYRSFKNEDELADALSDAVRIKRDEEKKGLLAAQETLRKRLDSFKDEKARVEARLRDLLAAEKQKADRENSEKQKAGKEPTGDPPPSVDVALKGLLEASAADDGAVIRLKNKTPERTDAEKISLALYDPKTKKEDLAVWHKTVERQIAWISGQTAGGKSPDESTAADIKRIDETARNQLWVANVIFRANLERDSDKLRGRSPRLLDIGPVFKEGNGAYVIYQTARTAAIVVLVFAVVSVLLLLLRLIPFFASAAETVRQQLGDVYKSSGGGGGGGTAAVGPQLARSLVLTAAALGVGTAVVVAGNSISDGGPRVAVAGATSDDRPDHSTVNRGTTVNNTRNTGGGDNDKTTVEFNPEIIYPEPYVIRYEVPVLVPSGGGGGGTLSLPQDFVKVFTDAAGRLDTLSKQPFVLKSDVSDVKQYVDDRVDSKVTSHLDNLQTNVLPALASKEDLQKESERIGWRVFDIDTRVLGVEQNLGETLAGLSNNLANTNALLSRQNSGGRNFFTATRQVFLGGDTYMASPEAASALRRQMCGGTPCADAGAESLLKALAEMVGQPPQDDGKFMKALSAKMVSLGPGPGLTATEQKALKDWKSVVLKFTRLSF